MSYEVADEIAAKKLPVLVDLKWPEADKDADPDDVPIAPNAALPRSRAVVARRPR